MNLANYIITFFIFLLFVIPPTNRTHFLDRNTCSSALIKSDKDLKIKKLIRAYPDFLAGHEGDSSLIWKDGTRMRFDDGVQNKTYQEMLNNADIEDMFFFDYPKDSTFIFGDNYDPGRIRDEGFLKKMYGRNAKEVSKNLVSINWISNKKLRITRINGIDKKLQKIADELTQKPHLKKYLVNSGGTYKWRKISGTNRLSCHSFGIAIDINVKYSAYWKWVKAKNGKRKYQNKIPYEIVKVFEKHGFIWGGKWTSHFDTMHFEYRPELLIEL